MAALIKILEVFSITEDLDKLKKIFESALEYSLFLGTCLDFQTDAGRTGILLWDSNREI